MNNKVWLQQHKVIAPGLVAIACVGSQLCILSAEASEWSLLYSIDVVCK